jgi:type III secretory pathway component EscS
MEGFHIGITCDGCNKSNFVGNRFKLVQAITMIQESESLVLTLRLTHSDA